MGEKTAAIIVAAGNSTRMGGTPKQLIKLCGKEVICHTLSAFEKSELVDEIILVCREQDEEVIKDIVKKNGFSKVKGFAHGGEVRSQSVKNGLELISEDISFIAIHDGARPLVTSDMINKAVASAHKNGASALGVPVKDTIKVVSRSGEIIETPDRSTLVAIQTPQVFSRSIYFSAVQKAESSSKEYTDDCALVEDLGKPVFVTEGSYENIKITTPEDIITAEGILNKRLEIQH